MFFFFLLKYLIPNITDTNVKMRGDIVAPSNSLEKSPLAIKEIEFIRKNPTIPMTIILMYFGRYVKLSAVTRCIVKLVHQ